MSFAQRFCVSVMAITVMTACGSSDGGPADPPGPPGDIRLELSLSVSTLTIESGASGTLTATTTLTGGLAGPVSIVTAGAPAGVSASASNIVTSGASTTGTITVLAAASVAAGSYPLIVTASVPGASSVRAALTLVVTEAPPAPDFALTVASPLSLSQGETGATGVTIGRTSFTGAVALSATGLPSGVSAGFSPAAPTTDSSTLTLQVGADAAPGSYPIVIVGTATPGTRSDTLSLTIIVAGSYALTANPDTLTVAPAGSVSTAVSVAAIGGFSGAVALSVGGLPSGMSAAFNPATTTSNSTLTLTTTGAAPGTSTLTITGTTAGLTDMTTSLAVTVMPGNTGTTVTLDFAPCELQDRAVWLAYRDGPSAAWTPVPGVADRYTFTLTGDLGGLAVAGDGSLEVLLERSSSLAEFGANVCALAGAERRVAGTTTGLPANAEGLVSYGSSAVEVANGSPDFAIPDAPLGAHDLIGYVRTSDVVSFNDRVAIRRDVDPAPPGNVAALDFAGSESFAPQFAGVQLAGAGTQALKLSMSYLTRSGVDGSRCDIATLYDELNESGTAVAVFGVPADRQRPDDQHQLQIRATTTTGSTVLFQEVVESFHALTPRNMVLPDPFNPTASRVSGSSHHRLRVQGMLPAGLESLVALSTGRSTDRDFGFVVSAGWLPSGTVDVTMPDLSGVAGFNPAWAPGATELVDYTIVGVSSLGINGLAQPCLRNGRIAGAGKEGVLPD